MIEQLLICGLGGFVVSFGVIFMTLRLGRRFKLAGRQNDFHHAHAGSISRLGGIGLAAAFTFVALLCLTAIGRQYMEIIPVIGASLAMFGLGLWDDLHALGAKRKLFGQVIIAAAACHFGINITLFKIPLTSHVIVLGAFWSWLATVFWLVTMTNLINLIDGVDGLAGGISLMLMLLMSVVGGAGGCVSFVAAGMSGALIAFLWFNFPPAKIYMGDGGAYFLGSLIGLLTIASSHKGTVAAALVAPLFVLALPILDTSLAITRRGLHGLPLFRADRRHIHHQLLETGLSRRKVVLGLYGFTAFCLGLGFIMFWGRGQYLPLILGVGVLMALLVVGRFKFSSEWLAVGRVLGNSMTMRAEIQYALAQTRWLVMEGSRSQSILDLCEDTVFIARKLGYDSVHIQLEDGVRTWCITPVEGKELRLFRQNLPGQRYIFIEFGVTADKVREDTAFLQAKNQQKSVKMPGNVAKSLSTTDTGAFARREYTILSELLAEGWAKAVVDWGKRYKLPLRFDGQKTPVSRKQSLDIPGAEPATT